ncbi:iron-sulfur cluster assembly protein [Trypanosoma grayi]|uniref:iron-sulfur cluster assembly protein n=1 Tax=Trypanosoma grayi TaxID=71804 RepID=UPI0004F48349|nr:iron-sulfur cluster assembly protein [Trypanosoma grayi]KEG12700.1 iron-sulfur cluster assembly protein [Trypanosoma grayi]
MALASSATALSPLLPCLAFSCWRAVQMRGCASTHTAASNSDNAGSSSSNGNTASSPMPYKSTHRGSGDAALPRKHNGSSPSAAASGSSDAQKSPNLAGSRSSCTEDGGSVPSRPLSPLQRRQLLFKHKAAFTLTPQALRRVKYLLGQCREKEQLAPDGIRISVRRRGCSGYSYTVNYHYPQMEEPLMTKSDDNNNNNSRSSRNDRKTSNAGDLRKKDVVVEQDGVKVVVDSDALFYVIGTEMDYVVRNVEEKFTFRNPNQKYSCGCEESFMPFDIDEQE